MTINIIVARSKNNVIGNHDNDLPWHIPSDLQYFKSKTANSIVVMGRKTFKSLPFPLPNRFNVILSRDESLPFNIFKKYEKNNSYYGYLKSIDDFMAKVEEEKDSSEIWVMGGAQIYKQFLDAGIVDKCYVTEVDCTIENDGTLPMFELGDEWELKSSITGKKTEKDEYNFKFCLYER